MIDLRHFLGRTIHRGQPLKLGGFLGIERGDGKVVEVDDKQLEVDGHVHVALVFWKYEGPVRVSLKIDRNHPRRCAIAVVLRTGGIEDPHATYEVRGNELRVTAKLGTQPTRFVFLRNHEATDIWLHYPAGNPLSLKFWMVPARVVEESETATFYDPRLLPATVEETVSA